MKLFSLRCIQSNKLLDEHFSNKKAAKAERDRFNN